MGNKVEIDVLSTNVKRAKMKIEVNFLYDGDMYYSSPRHKK